MPTPSLETWLATRVKDVPGEAALAAAKLLADGYTVPFLARHRPEETGGQDEAALRRVVAAREVFERLEARRATILEAAERHKKRTPVLEERLFAASDLASLEDLALPFRKKKGETVLAREAGLEPLADWIWATGHGTEIPQEGQTLDLWAFTFRNPEKGVVEATDAIAGARALLVERLAEDPDLRALVRRVLFADGVVEAVKTEKAKAGSKHEAALGLREKAKTLREADHLHRVFGLRRAANEGEVKLRVVLPEGEESPRKGLEEAFAAAAVSLPDAPGATVLQDAARDALDAHVWPDMAAELLQSLREDADRTAIRPLAEGLRRRLMAPALGNQPVLGLHPTKDGGVLALVDPRGRFVKGERFALADDQIALARERILTLAREGEVTAVAVGDGTAGRERAQFVEETLAGGSLSSVVVQVLNEAAAAAWRASEAASTELPETEVETMGAVALARRLQDPLRELARTEPRVLAEGAYLHEVSQRLLAKRLEQTLETCLHDVGVDLNRAAAATLARLAGFSAETATALVARREAQGPFASRAALRETGLLDAKAFEQAAAFLMVSDSVHPLDRTRVHPERYAALEACAARLDKGLSDLLGEGAAALREDVELRAALGPRALDGLVAQLSAASRDPRGPFVPFRYRADVRRLEDLKPGMECPGLVTNATTFGVFVDIGVPHDGLVHVSQLPPREAEKAAPLLLPGDRVEVRVVKVDLAKKQISLSMRGAPARSGERPRPARPRGDGKERSQQAERTGDRRPRGSSPARPGSSRPRPAPRKATAGASPFSGDAKPPSPPASGAARAAASGPRRDARPEPTRGSRPGRPPTRPDRPPPRPEPTRPSARPPAFNNPFAVLASLKDPKKG